MHQGAKEPEEAAVSRMKGLKGVLARLCFGSPKVVDEAADGTNPAEKRFVLDAGSARGEPT